MATEDQERDFDPTNLESRLVSRPLLDQIALYEKQRAAPGNVVGADWLPEVLPVVIDLNFSFTGGLSRAKSNVLELLETHGVAMDGKDIAVSGQKVAMVFKRKTKLSAQYVFAKLPPETIRWLALKVRTEDEESTKTTSLKNREIFMIWPDFKVEKHIYRTVATTKADAARKSFSAEGGGIIWAVLDSGISKDHKHFKRHQNLEGLEMPVRHMDFTRDWEDPDDFTGQVREDAIDAEAEAALTDEFGHGSHVAGILAGEYVTDSVNGWSGPGQCLKDDLRYKYKTFVWFKRRTEEDKTEYSSFRKSHLSGVAPLTKLVSFKVLDDNGEGEVSNIIAALAMVQQINEHGRNLRIHGVNLSVGYPFNPEWFASGKSPLCVEVDRLVKSGVVVVVSAGNSGYGTKSTTMTRGFQSGMLMTINDPGNARLALTVGSTHRDKPHEYGPSYFSSKGPTGDGRYKPDLLAPGERIYSCGVGNAAKGRGRPQDRNRLYVDQTGTSMAAPHVSGAIAAFLSIRREFIGQPERVKEIFMQSATDLGRDRYMQGAGLIDLMRAIQSV